MEFIVSKIKLQQYLNISQIPVSHLYITTHSPSLVLAAY